MAGLVSGDLRPLVLLVVTIPVLVTGALVNVFRGSFSPALFVGADTPVGNTAALSIVFWYAWGTVLAVLPMTVLVLQRARLGGLRRRSSAPWSSGRAWRSGLVPTRPAARGGCGPADAPPEAIFDAFVALYDSERPDWVTSSQLDLRPGGRWSVAFQVPDGGQRIRLEQQGFPRPRPATTSRARGRTSSPRWPGG